MVEQMLEQRDILVLLVMPVAEGLAHRVGSDLTQPDFLRRLVQYFISPVPFNETVINPPAELGRLTDAGGGEQSIKIENSAV